MSGSFSPRLPVAALSEPVKGLCARVCNVARFVCIQTRRIRVLMCTGLQTRDPSQTSMTIPSELEDPSRFRCHRRHRTTPLSKPARCFIKKTRPTPITCGPLGAWAATLLSPAHVALLVREGGRLSHPAGNYDHYYYHYYYQYLYYWYCYYYY